MNCDDKCTANLICFATCIVGVIYVIKETPSVGSFEPKIVVLDMIDDLNEHLEERYIYVVVLLLLLFI